MGSEPDQVGVGRTDSAAPAGELARVEQRLVEVRHLLEQSQRLAQHKEFSLARLMGALCQALVIGLLAWSLSDWVFGGAALDILVKLGFAAVLQLAALTGFVMERGG